MRNWLARLSFSFLIIAAVLGWETYRGLQTGTLGVARAALYLLAGGMAIGLGIMGIRERHRGMK